MYASVVMFNDVLNGLVIDLSKVDQIVMIIVTSKPNTMVAVNDLDHHTQKEMNLDLKVNVLHVLHVQKENGHRAPKAIALGK